VWGLLDRHAATIRSETRSPVPAELSPVARALRRKVHQTIRRITDDVEERLKLNTAVSALIELEHAIADAEKELAESPERPVFREALETLVLLLRPFSRHMGEEMWELLGRRFSIVARPWPVADAAIAREDELEFAVQVNGKVRG